MDTHEKLTSVVLVAITFDINTSVLGSSPLICAAASRQNSIEYLCDTLITKTRDSFMYSYGLISFHFAALAIEIVVRSGVADFRRISKGTLFREHFWIARVKCKTSSRFCVYRLRLQFPAGNLTVLQIAKVLVVGTSQKLHWPSRSHNSLQ